MRAEARIASTYVEDSGRRSRSGVVPDAPTDATALMMRAGKIVAYEPGTSGRCLSTVPPPRWRLTKFDPRYFESLLSRRRPHSRWRLLRAHIRRTGAIDRIADCRDSRRLLNRADISSVRSWGEREPSLHNMENRAPYRSFAPSVFLARSANNGSGEDQRK